MKNFLWVILFLVRSAFAGPLDPFLTWNGELLPQENTGVENLSYIAPNEYRPDLFQPVACREEAGVLLSVGTFRGLMDFIGSNCTYLIQFDYNLGAKVFNITNLQLISKSQDRFEYLAFLVTGIRNHPVIDAARKGEVEVGEMLETLKKEFPDDSEVVDRWQQEGVNFENQAAIDLLKKANPNAKPGQPKTRLGVQLRIEFRFSMGFMLGLGSFQKTFLGSDKSFSLMQKKIQEGRIKVMQGDVFHENVFISLGKILENNHQRVSAFDISNISDYLLSENPLTPVERYLLIQNGIQKMPLSSHFRLLFTGNNTLLRSSLPEVDVFRKKWDIPFLSDGDSSVGTWHYYAITLSHLKMLEETYSELGLIADKAERSFRFQALLYWRVPVSEKDPGRKVLYELRD